MTLLLALSVWAMCRDQRTRAGIALGLLLASKQNLVVVLPSFLSVWRAGVAAPWWSPCSWPPG
ncbi:hypothetical protein [Nocardioides houyundeii]|uniref:hypothetical protein n=1 Tax=Nocardioides houyundeii TaxID=2045452 RepID=UPI0013152419|nr:hypothetical protein [Nocardioides houyundeii]